MSKREDFIKEMGVVATVSHVYGEPMLGEEAHFCVILRHKNIWEPFRYMMGSGLFEEYKKAVNKEKALSSLSREPSSREAARLRVLLEKHGLPKLKDFYDSLVLDCRDIAQGSDFEEWCDDLGYDKPGEALRVWEACQSEWSALKRVLGRREARQFVNIEEEEE